MPHDILTCDIILGTRFREDYGDISDLASSMAKYGLLQPIVIDDKLNLIAGGRRLTAAKSLNWTTIPCLLRNEVDEQTSRELELEENIRRKDLTWVEQARLVSEIDALKRAKYGSAVPGSHTESGWDQSDTATAINSSQPSVSRSLVLARIVEACPEIASEATPFAAMKKFDSELEALERELARRESTSVETGFVCGDVLFEIENVPDASVDLIIMDPPYGIEMTGQTNRPNYEVHFDDTAPTALDFFFALVPKLRRILKPNGHLYCFAGLKPAMDIQTGQESPLYWIMTKALTHAGFSPDPIPLAWVKNRGTICDFSYRFSFMWEPIIYCGHPDRALSKFHTNVFPFDSVPGSERTNIMEKPVALLRELIELSTAVGETVYDPCAGSGNTLVAAKAAGRHYAGCEKDHNQWNSGMLKLLQTQNLLDAAVSTPSSTEENFSMIV